MKDNKQAFIDTNILVYRIYGTDYQKESVLAILENQKLQPVISTQVLKEFVNVSFRKKLHKSTDELKLHIVKTTESFNVAEITPFTISNAIDLKEQYLYSFYDSLIIATALESGCTILYSEDLQHHQTIRKTLKIINPFK